MRKLRGFIGNAALALAISGRAMAQVAPDPNIVPLSREVRMAMTGRSWNPCCPVPLDDLVGVSVRYIGFDGFTHDGILVVHKRVATDVSHIFAELYDIHFPINRISPWENYGPDKYAEQDITVGFYCEKADDAPGEWSSHAYGIAIDINPLENPFRMLQKPWWPKGSAVFAPRDGGRGKVSAESNAFRIFARYGWGWGGLYKGETDYMHFYKNMDRRALEVAPPK
ncbi:MAG: M15 family metallopeptidase [Bryobacteraceae bacterium]